MLVRQLIGPYAGQIVEMPHAVAQNCLAAGTAAKPKDTPRVRGLVIPNDGSGAAASLDVPEGWQTMHHMKRKALARKLTGQSFAALADADAAIRAHLQSV